MYLSFLKILYEWFAEFSRVMDLVVVRDIQNVDARCVFPKNRFSEVVRSTNPTDPGIVEERILNKQYFTYLIVFNHIIRLFIRRTAYAIETCTKRNDRNENLRRRKTSRHVCVSLLFR